MAHETLNWKQVRKLRKESREGASNPRLARKYGVSRPQISKIVNNKAWVEDNVRENSQQN